MQVNRKKKPKKKRKKCEQKKPLEILFKQIKSKY